MVNLCLCRSVCVCSVAVLRLCVQVRFCSIFVFVNMYVVCVYMCLHLQCFRESFTADGECKDVFLTSSCSHAGAFETPRL